MTGQYVPGSCNIGPEEIALRRRFGHAGLAVTAALGAALLRSGRHPAWRLALALPAAGAAAGYLQARHHFCANYGFRGLYNFDARGQERPVPAAGPGAAEAREQDRRRSVQIATASAAIGLGVALLAVAV
jgi:peptidoglycan/LPS O-acetylase OafA/YrhL